VVPLSATDENRTLTGARWSSVTRTGCARVGVYGHQHAPIDELPDRRREELRRYFTRGKLLEEWAISEDLASGALSDRIERQVEIPWPLRADLDEPIGTGHADVYDPVERGIVEYVSTAGAALPDGKVEQAAGYALNHPGAEAAVVVSIDPHTLERREYPIDLSGVEPRVRDLEDAVVAGVAGDLPARVCGAPSDGYHRGCPFVSHCFDGWQPTPLDQLVGLDQDLEALADAEDDVAAAKEVLERASERREEIRAKLRPVLIAGEEYKGAKARIRVKRSVWVLNGGLSMSDAAKAGHELPADLRAFVSPPSPRERWTVKRLGSDGRPE
jgi:hypothetical protein